MPPHIGCLFRLVGFQNFHENLRRVAFAQQAFAFPCPHEINVAEEFAVPLFDTHRSNAAYVDPQVFHPD